MTASLRVSHVWDDIAKCSFDDLAGSGVELVTAIVEDAAGNVYNIRGAKWFGSTENAQQGGTFQATFTGKLQVLARGSGTVNSVNVTQHITSVNGNIKEFDFGTCVAP